MKETELAQKVLTMLSGEGFSLYQEVQLFAYGEIADIVAVRIGNPSFVWVIETKTSRNLEVLAQAIQWQRWADYVSVAVPSLRHSPGSRLWERVAKEEGIGVLEVVENFRMGFSEKIKPKLQRNPYGVENRRRWVALLREEHKTFAPAGNANGKRWTRFQETKKNLERFVAEHPGATLKDVVNNVNCHYSDLGVFRSCIYSWSAAGKFAVKVHNGRVYPTNFDLDSLPAVTQRHTLASSGQGTLI